MPREPTTDADELCEADETLDAREIEEEPFGAIVRALNALDEGETLGLINSFEPVPLYDVLDERGFDHETRRVADEEVHVFISHARA